MASDSSLLLPVLNRTGHTDSASEDSFAPPSDQETHPDIEDADEPKRWWCTFCTQIGIFALCDYQGCRPSERDPSRCSTCERQDLKCDMGGTPTLERRAPLLKLQRSFETFYDDRHKTSRDEFYDAQLALLLAGGPLARGPTEVAAACEDVALRIKFHDKSHQALRSFKRGPWWVLNHTPRVREIATLRNPYTWGRAQPYRPMFRGLEIQLRGTILQGGCKRCAAGHGHFAACVVLIIDGGLGKRRFCGNCTTSRVREVECGLDDVPELQGLLTGPPNARPPRSKKRRFAPDPSPIDDERDIPAAPAAEGPAPNPSFLLANFARVSHLAQLELSRVKSTVS